MAALDSHEQEQLEAFMTWWRDNRTQILAALLIVVTPGRNAVKRVHDVPLAVNDERGADDASPQLSLEFLFLQHTVAPADLAIDIGE